MNSRERLKKVINHQIPDRIPIDFGSMRSVGISTIAYNKILAKLGIKNKLPRMYDFIQQLAYPEEEILKMFHVDTIDAGQAFLKSEDDLKTWILNDGTKCKIPKYLNIETDSSNTVYLKVFLFLFYLYI